MCSPTPDIFSWRTRPPPPLVVVPKGSDLTLTVAPSVTVQVPAIWSADGVAWAATDPVDRLLAVVGEHGALWFGGGVARLLVPLARPG